MKIKHLSIITALVLLSSMTYGQDDWVDLIKGKTLKGWKQLNGNAKYELIDGTIVGTTINNTPNSFLVTKKDYADFVLEFDFKVDPKLNSGVQIRSHSLKEYNNGRVHGYQIEIDPSDRAWSAGIYDEARRGWLYPLDKNPKAQKAFKQNGWNHYHIEAIGNNLRTWINGVPATNLIDDADASGFIALQVHGIGRDKSKEGIQIMWKNIRIATENLDAYIWKNGRELKQISTIPNTLTDQEKANDWKLLWDGGTTSGWRGANNDAFPEGGWELSNQTLSVNESGGGESAHGGDIVTIKQFGSFELSIDFKLSTGANSGIKYFVTEGQNNGVGSAIGLEFQLLDDKEHPDANNGVGGNRTISSLYDLIPASESKKVNAPGKWNNARIVVDGNHVEHWLNNQLVLEYTRGTQMFRALVQKSKYAKYPNFGEHKQGHILLQDHGNHVSFRNIKIREL
ncbi:MAG: DUF1080 domain-containing protein [Bacteroidales bacterium]|nr:DUF1080 domain-containing protein [Bacteroidales bacterium]